MTEETDNRPIHPIYKTICDASNKESSHFQKIVDDAMETKNYSEIQKLRFERAEQLSKLPQPDLIHSTQVVTGGPDKIKVKLEIFRPVGSENEVLPILLFSHGGGFILCDMYTHRQSIFDFATGVHAIVVFVEYSLSPEVKFPVATEEVFSALCWVRENAASINGDPEKIIVLGDSAGGNLSAVVSLMAKDRGLGDVIKAQVLICPAVSDSKGFPSGEKYGKGDYLLSSKDMNIILKAYCPKLLKGLGNSYASPLLASVEELSGLPPALIITAECDILRDESEAYAAKLLEAGVEVVGIRVLGTIHSFLTIEAPPTPQYQQGLNACVSFIKEKLNLK